MWLVELFMISLVVGTVLGLGWRAGENYLENRRSAEQE